MISLVIQQVVRATQPSIHLVKETSYYESDSFFLTTKTYYYIQQEISHRDKLLDDRLFLLHGHHRCRL